jgi:hypothetical protein
MEYENVTQKVLFILEYFLYYTFIFRKQFYLVLSDLKITGPWNPDTNLESLCISSHWILRAMRVRNDHDIDSDVKK